MTTANKVTIVRILLVPFFAWQLLEYVHDGAEWNRVLAIVCFGAAAVSDGLDGFIARRYNQRSELGAILDPLADRLLLLTAVVLLSLNNAPHLDQLPLWLAVTLISRDVLVSLGVVLVQHICGKVELQARWLSKSATVLQMAIVVWTLLKWDAVWHHRLAVVTAVCTLLGGLQYVLDGMRQLSASPSSGPNGRS